MDIRKYYDEADLVDAATIIKAFCSTHICESCPFAIIFNMSNNEKRVSCKLRRIPKDWDLSSEKC